MPENPKADKVEGQTHLTSPDAPPERLGLVGVFRRIRALMAADRIPGVSLVDGYLKRRAERKLAGMVPRD